MDTAPFYNDIAEGPDGGTAHWLTTADGVRIRVGYWPKADSKGTVLMFPGRTEFIEKYGRSAASFAERGYATLAIDWRGQGLADRIAADHGLGHVRMFSDYQLDVTAAVEFAKSEGLPGPFFLCAHSMGGAIGLRALHRGLDVKAVGFSAPMWGMTMAPYLRPFAWGISMTARALGFEEMVVPGQTTENYVGRTPFNENLLTTDPEFFEHLERQLTAHPELGIGGPSTLWLNEALIEMNRLQKMPSPDVPCITYLGTDEKIVHPGRIRDRMSRWSKGRLTVLNGAKHEPMMDNTGIGLAMFDEMCAFFDTHL